MTTGSAEETLATRPLHASPGCSAPRSTAHLLTPASDASIQIVNPTADDAFVIYVQTITDADGGTTADIMALPLDGGAPTTILSNLPPSSAYVVVDESTVFIWNNVTPSGVGTLTIWTQASGTQVASTASAPFFSAASPNSRHVVFSTNVSDDGTFGDLVSASPATPGAQTTLLTNTVLYGSATFIPSLVFQPSGQPNPSSPGFVSNHHFVTSHEESGSATITISSWDSATWTKRDLVVGAQANTQLALQNWNSDDEGRHIAALTAEGQLEVVPVEGPASAAVLVGPATGTTTFALDSSGQSIVYGSPPSPSETAPATPLFTADLHRPLPAEIVDTGFGGVYFPWENGVLGPSPDGRQVLYFSTESTSFGFLYSLNIVANAPHSTPVAIDATDTATVPADPFTADSRYVIYLANLDTSTGAAQLFVWDIARGRPIALTDLTAGSANSLFGSTVLYNDNYNFSAGGPNGVADLKTVDVSDKTLTPKTIQLGADGVYYLTPDRSRVIYTMTGASDPSANGIYVHRF